MSGVPKSNRAKINETMKTALIKPKNPRIAKVRGDGGVFRDAENMEAIDVGISESISRHAFGSSSSVSENLKCIRVHRK